jgi:predicted ester cyclase
MEVSVTEAAVSEAKAQCRRIVYEAFSEGRVEVLDEVLAPDFVNHAGPPGLDRGIEGVKLVIKNERAGFPDLQYEVTNEIEEGDFVVQHCRVTGTHLGPIFGVEPTGRRVVWNEIHIGRMTGNLVAEHWACNDMHSVWIQIGKVEPPRLTPAGAR